MTDLTNSRRFRFSIRDLVILISVAAVAFGLLVPALLRTRERARRTSCSNGFRQLGLALHNYHSAYKRFPMAMGGTGVGPTPQHGNANRLSGLVALTPFVESSGRWEQIANPLFASETNYPAMGPVPWDKNYPPWKDPPLWIQCPSNRTQATVTVTNYLFSIGDHTSNIHAGVGQVARGVFLPRTSTRLNEIIDGTSNTIMMMETATASTDRVAGQFVIDVPSAKLKVPQDCYQFLSKRTTSRYNKTIKLSDLGRGGNWADGAGGYSLVHTILPPNGPSVAMEGTAEVDGIFTSSSRHPGGCYVLMADGAVVFITNNIDTGDLNADLPTTALGESPYGILGALGTRSGGEGDVGFDY